jgi:hypothetical protein
MKLELARQIEADDPQGDLLTFIEDMDIDEGKKTLFGFW